MLLLAFDTAGPNCAAALARDTADGPEVLARSEERLGRGHSERLMPMIELVLRQAGAVFEDIDRIGVTTGPGSFTGVRVGLATARGLALALDVPAVGIGTLEALAYPLRRTFSEGTAVAVLDAKRGEIYAEVSDLRSGAVLIEAAARAPADLAAALSDAARPLILTGSAAPALADLLGEIGVELAAQPDSPDISDVARLALEATPDRRPVPLYARGADAKPQSDKAVARR